MSFDYASLITDRTVSDSDTLKALLGKPMAEWTAEELTAFNRAVMKGSYNYTDLNRVDACLEDLVARLGRLGYSVPGYERVKIERTVTPSSRLPDGYTELAYIQSTGTQWIDTNFKPNQNTRVKMDCNVIGFNSSDMFLFGARIASGNTAFGVAADDDNAQWWTFFGNGQGTPQGTCIGKHTIDFNKNTLSLDGNVFSFDSTSFQSDYNLLLFASITNGSVDSQRGKMSIYSCQVYDDGTLVRDFIPCQNPSGVIGLYDLTTGEFYGNSGTGAFFAGPRKVTLPEGYTQLEYIQSNGQQYIDTGITPDQDTQIVYDCERLSAAAAEHFFGVRTGNGANHAFCFYIYNSGWRFAYNSTVESLDGPAAGRYLFDADRNRMKINGSVVMQATYAQFTAASAALLFAMRSTPSGLSYGSHNLFSCQIHNNGTLIRNFIPCKNASGAVGLYDTVGAEFYPNAGTGSFTAGAAVTWPEDPDEPSAELDPYIWYESDVPTAPLMARYRANVAAVRGALALPEGTPAVPSTMRRLTPAAANSIEAVLLALDIILTNLPAAVRHCGVSTCGSKGVIA